MFFVTSSPSSPVVICWAFACFICDHVAVHVIVVLTRLGCCCPLSNHTNLLCYHHRVGYHQHHHHHRIHIFIIATAAIISYWIKSYYTISYHIVIIIKNIIYCRRWLPPSSPPLPPAAPSPQPLSPLLLLLLLLLFIVLLYCHHCHHICTVLRVLSCKKDVSWAPARHFRQVSGSIFDCVSSFLFLHLSILCLSKRFSSVLIGSSFCPLC